MKELHKLTALQIELLDTLWRRGEATVRDVYEAQEATLGLALKTVGTVLRRLEEQGILAHRRERRRFVYRSRVSREDVRDAAVQAAADDLFDGSVPALLIHSLRNGHVDAPGRARVRQTLDELDGSG